MWEMCFQVAEYENCRLLLVDKKITTARDIVGVLEAAIRGAYPLLIMAEDIEQEPLATLVRIPCKPLQTLWRFPESSIMSHPKSYLLLIMAEDTWAGM